MKHQPANKGWRKLPTVTYQHKKWFFDQRLKQLRNVTKPLDFIDLNDFETEYFRQETQKAD